MKRVQSSQGCEKTTRGSPATLEAVVTPDVRDYFRGQFREARAWVLRDGEAFEAIVLVVERLGRLLNPGGIGLKDFGGVLEELASRSALTRALPRDYPQYHIAFSVLFELVREGRNAAVHEGALARHLTVHALGLALTLEDALMPEDATVAAFMVKGPVTAAPWHPISFIRQAMLAGSFSYLPVQLPGTPEQPWGLVSDVAVAAYLRRAAQASERGRRLRTCLKDAVDGGEIRLDVPRCVKSDERAADLIPHLTTIPVLVVGDRANELLGILTAFDLL